MRRASALLVVLALVVAGCLTQGPIDDPSPVPSAAGSTAPSVPPRQAGQLVIAIPADPTGFVPPAEDEPTAILGSLLYDPLYRLDERRLRHQALASGAPEVTDDGLGWSIPLRTGGAFHDGSPVHASDVVFTMALARSPSCPFVRDLCAAAQSYVADVTADGAAGVDVTLHEPWSPLLAVVLGRLPILSESAVRRATRAIVSGAARLQASTLNEQVAAITEQTNADRCLVERPPSGCLLADHVDDLLATLDGTGVAVPPRERFAGTDGSIDEEAYGEALLGTVATLATVLDASDIDQAAAALPLIDVIAQPLGGGPYVPTAYTPGRSVELARHDDHVTAPAGSETVSVRIIRDPAAATTALRAADVDWLVDVDPTLASSLMEEPELRAGPRSIDIVRSIVFNVREDRVFADPVARRAFAQCLDRPALVTRATGGTAGPAVAELPAGGWATPDVAAIPPADPDAATAALDDAGWTRGDDGIYERDGVRLSAEIYVRPTRIDLVTFGREAAEQLRACGIELIVSELDLAGEVLLEQLQWPNDFEVVLVARPLGVDPGVDLEAFESEHATSADNPGDRNPGGYRSSVVDGLLADARGTADVAERTRLYGLVNAQLREDVPSIPVWYDTAYAALSGSITAVDGPPDPTVPRYWWDAWTWSRGGA